MVVNRTNNFEKLHVSPALARFLRSIVFTRSSITLDGIILSLASLVLRNQVLCRRRPFRKEEREAAVHEPAGNDLAAFENEFGFGAQQETGDFYHPRRSRQTN